MARPEVAQEGPAAVAADRRQKSVNAAGAGQGEGRLRVLLRVAGCAAASRRAQGTKLLPPVN
eukprot:1884013-Prymnesium_polylepis.1